MIDLLTALDRKGGGRTVHDPPEALGPPGGISRGQDEEQVFVGEGDAEQGLRCMVLCVANRLVWGLGRVAPDPTSNDARQDTDREKERKGGARTVINSSRCLMSAP